MNRVLPALLLGFFVSTAGLCLFFSPPGRILEENLGLYLLFKLRGVRPPPEEVVIIGLDDDESSAQADLPENVSAWPRSLYAGIVESLSRQGASVIVFDVHFSRPGNQDEDQAFAKAIGKAGNVLLSARLQRKTLHTGYQGGTDRTIVKENIIRPVAPLAEPALAVAPFPLPKFPVRVNQFWTFKTLAGEIPTLPAAALQAHEFQHYELLHRLIREKIPDITKLLPPSGEEALASQGLINILCHLRSLFLQDKRLADYLLAKIADESPMFSPAEKKGLTALVRMYEGENSRYLNFYGPPGTVKTLSHVELGASAGDDLQNKVVFVGAVRKSWSEQKDGFYTVYTQPDGLDLSSVEIAATVFANLHEDMDLQPLAPEASTLFIFCCGFGAVLAAFFLPPLPSATAIITGIAALSVSGCYFFAVRAVWIPVLTPLFFQPVLAFFSVLYWKFLNTQREKENMSKALGLYLPEKVVRELSQDPGFIKTGDQMVYSVCLQTDAQHYTTLSEKTQPKELGNLMREYYRHIFEPVRNYGGVVSDVVGDAMLAIWPSTTPRDDLRVYACKAALEILSAADRFNRKHHTAVLPTRIGMHYGYMLLGNIGAESHYEYTPVGDIVNTTSRIEKLNKHLNTKVLASIETIEDLPEIISREIGAFLLSGKSEPIIIHELIADAKTIDIHQEKLCESFRQALTLFREENWELARRGFARCLAICENDGPSNFYLHLCQTYLSNPPPRGRRGIVHIDTR